MSAKTIFMPSCKNFSAILSQIPLAAPVITATLLENSFIFIITLIIFIKIGLKIIFKLLILFYYYIA